MKSPIESIGFLIHDVSRLLRRRFAEKLEGSQLTLAQARALVYVSKHEGVRQVDLAELLDIAPMTLARQIDQLAECGVLERRADPNDRRAYQLFLKKGAAPHLAAIEQVIAEIRAIAFHRFSKAESEALQGALNKLRGNLATP